MSKTQQGLWNRSFILCLLNNFFLFSYYYALLTILPIYILKELGGTVEEAGLALTLFLISSIAIRPFTGLIIEKLGKKKSMRGAGLIFAFFAFGYVLIDSLWSLLLIRFIHGIWFSILTTVTVPVASDFIPEKRKGEGIGYFVMSTNLGVVFGPLIALTAMQYTSFNILFALLAGIITTGLIFSWLLNIQDNKKAENTSEKSKLSIHDIIEFRVIAVGMVALLTAFSYSSVMSFITAFAESKQLLAYTSMFFIVFAISMLVVRPWVGKIYDRKGPSYVLYPCFALFAIGLIGISFMSSALSMWLSAIFIGIGYGSVFPCLQTLAIQSVEQPRMGHAISTFFTLFDIGMAIGSVCMGILIAHFGFAATYQICAVVVIVTVFGYRQFIAAKRTSVQA